MVARYGGEEFVVMLQNIDKEGVKNVAKSLIDAVSDLKIIHEYSSIAKNVTISLGIGFKEMSDNLCGAEFLKKADDALYRAKENGRNRFEMSE